MNRDKVSGRKTVVLLAFALVAFLATTSSQLATANDKIKQAIRNYEKRVEAERAKVIAAFQREELIARRQQNQTHQQWIKEAKNAWMNDQMMVSERGGLRFLNSAHETFEAKDFNLSGDFKVSRSALKAQNGNATARLGKPAGAVYFRGMVESKNNFVVQLTSASMDQSKDLAIVVGGWNNTRSEIMLDNRTIASKPVGMPRRWLCEVCYDQKVVTIFANGVMLMTADVERPVPINLVNVSVSYDSNTTLHSPVLQVK